jgi:hypothetical protein
VAVKHKYHSFQAAISLCTALIVSRASAQRDATAAGKYITHFLAKKKVCHFGKPLFYLKHQPRRAYGLNDK